MTDTAAGRHALEGAAIASRPMRDPWQGNDFPDHPRPTEHAEAAAGPQPRAVADALAFATDRLDRVDHMLGSLQGTIQRLGFQLEGLLTDGSYSPGQPPTVPTDPTPEDRRSTIAKRVSELGRRADTHADWIATLERTVEALSDALEV